MKNPYIAARPQEVEGAVTKAAPAQLVETGMNTGNLLFIAAVRKIVTTVVPSSGIGFDPRQANENHDGIVVPAANWLNSSKDLGALAGLIERSKLPCVVVGLGAQSYNEAKYPTLLPGTERFLRVVSERSTSISVRGEYTASVVERAGVKNIRITGCPSLLWWVDRPAHVRKDRAEISRVVVHATRSDTDRALFTNPVYRIGLFMSRLAFKNGLDYVAQTELSDMIISKKQENEFASQLSYDIIRRVYDSRNIERIKSFIAKHVKYFSSVDEWVRFAGTKQFFVGTRLHGTIAALLAGTPALLITHDARTREMAEWCAMPYISADEVLSSDEPNFQHLYDAVDFGKFNERQKLYYSEFTDFFDENHVDHKLDRARPCPDVLEPACSSSHM